MLTLAARMSRAKPSAIMIVADKAKQLKAAGRDIISFSIGVPNFLPGPHVYDAVRDALAKTAASTVPTAAPTRLLDAFLTHLEEGGLTGYTRANIAIGIGAKHVLYNLAEALLDPGDEIAFAVPYWTTYVDIADILGAKIAPVAVSGQPELQADAGAARCGAAGAEGFPVQQPVQSDRHGVHEGRDRRARRRAGQASGHVDHLRRHLQPHGVRRRRLPQLRAGPAGTARSRHPGRLAFQDLWHAGLARRFRRRARNGRAGDRHAEFESHHEPAGNHHCRRGRRA